MEILKTPRALSVLFGLLAAAVLFAQPAIGTEPGPKNAPPDVREQIARMRSADPKERAAAIDRLGELGERAVPAIPELIAALADQGGVRTDVVELDRVGDHAADALRKIGAKAVDPLIGALKHPETVVRRRAANTLGWIKDPRAVEPLIGAFKDPQREVRLAALLALERFKNPRSVEPMIAALADPDRSVRSIAARALGASGDRRAVKPLIALLEGGDERSASSAAGALGVLKDPAAVEPLIAALDSPHASVRSEAAHALGSLKDPRAIGPLVSALKKRNEGACAYALGSIGQADPLVIDALLGALKSDRSHTRQAAATALGQLKERRAVEPLIATLRDPEWMVRYAAAYSLGQIGDLRAGDALRVALDDPQRSVRDRAAEALRMLQFRVWKDREGRELARGTFLDARGPNATLKKPDGSALVVPLEQLSVEDRQYVWLQVSNQQARAEGKSGAAKRQAEERENASKRVEELTQAIERNPRDWEAYLRRAEAWVKTGNIEHKAKALADCDEALRINPQSAEAFYVRGTIEMSLWPNYDRAIASLKEALRRKPEYPEARRALAAAYGRQWKERLRYAETAWDLAQATAELDEAHRLDPACDVALWARGLARAKAGRTDQALADFQQAARLAPDAEWTAQFHGLESFKKGDGARAVLDFVDLVALDSRLAVHYANRGQAFHVYGHYDKALADYNRAIRAQPLLDIAFMRRAWLRSTCPDAKYRDARLALRDAKDAVALSRKPTNLEALAAAHAEAGQFDEAVRTQEQAIALVQTGGWPTTDADKQAMQARLELYRARKPYREKPRPSPQDGTPRRSHPGPDTPSGDSGPKRLPRVVGIVEERQDIHGKWVPVAPDEVSWSGDLLRWSPRLEPDERSQIASFRVLKRLANDPQSPWVEVARAGSGERWAVGTLATGEWEIRIEVRLTSGAVIAGP